MNEHDCHVERLEKPYDREAVENAVTTYLRIQGMGCPNCAMRVRNGLLSLEGVYAVKIELERGLAAIVYNSESVITDDLIQAVASASNDGRHNYVARVIQ